MNLSPSFWLAIIFLCAGCRQKTKSPALSFTDSLRTNSSATILNDIVVHEAGGLQIDRAFLADSTGVLLPKNNLIEPGEPVFLTLVVRKGWVLQNDSIAIGAQQTIITVDGEPVLASTDLFAGQRLSKEMASQISLKTVLTKARNDTKAFIVRYAVWDKNSSASVNGFFRLDMAPKAGGE